MDAHAELPRMLQQGSSGPGLVGVIQSLACAAVAVAVLRLELQRRAGDGPMLGLEGGVRYAESAKRLLRQCAPEAAGLVTVLTLAAALRASGDTGVTHDQEAWENIKSQWPILMTADTLLALQAMLRLMVLISVALRARSGASHPLQDEPAGIWLGAALARAALLTRTSFYMLDGPVGGWVPAACELLVIPLLAKLGAGALRRSPVSALLLGLGAFTFAQRNHLSLADETLTNVIFVMAHFLDFVASFAYLVRTLLVDQGARGSRGSAAFVHVLMAVQSSLSAYYFVQAFEPVESLVGKGRPYDVLQLTNTAQLGAYLGSVALYFADSAGNEDAGDCAGDPQDAAGEPAAAAAM